MSRFFAKNHRLNIEEVIVHTGQHFDSNMSDVFFSELRIPDPKYNLGINNATHGQMTGRILEGMELVLLKEKPDYLLVYGDTNSTLAAALAAKKLGIKIIHVEAGLRSFNMNMPEEVNRILTDRLSSVLCCPTTASVENLKNEGFEKFDCDITLTGDIMEDALQYAESKFEEHPHILQKLGIRENEYILSTIHRQENVDSEERLNSIVSALEVISSDIRIVLPLHPRTRPKLNFNSKNILVIEPQGYTDNLKLLKHSRMVMTDSGGIQKEAYWLKKFCLTIRDETEWTELITNKCNFLVGSDKDRIVDTYESVKRLSWSCPDNLYGGGHAADAICSAILAYHERHVL